MKIILTQKHEKLGEAGKVVNVRPGFARNYLIPNKLALDYTSGNLKRYEEMKKLTEIRENRDKKMAEELAEALNKISCTASMAVGEDEKLFGSVTNQMIADLVREKGFEIDKRKIILEEPIKALGIYTVAIKLHPEVEAKIKLWVVKE
ncbi:50S ribosomal protein L9 [candidate division KSB1 bacterium]|nr:50S ribosomal protein L9 [candidate division KSB1 bacterium]